MGITARIRGLATGAYLHITKKGEIHALTDPRTVLNPIVIPFLNDTFGAAMNQNIAFSGTPEIIHNGGSSTEWTGSAIQGSWNFADAGKVSLSSGVANDEATFAEETPTTVAMSGFTALTGKINLTTYSPTNNTLNVIFDLAGVDVGNSVNLNDFIDPNLLSSEQNFVIPKGLLGLDAQTVDGFSIALTRSGGAQVVFTLDDIQLEQTGTPAVFKAIVPIGDVVYITEIRLGLADVLAATVTDGTALGLAYDKILAVASLSNGIVFRRIQAGETNFSVNFKQLGDFLRSGSNLINPISDGVNTFITLLVEFPEAIILEGDTLDGNENFLSFSISDNLSGLLEFTAAARGAIVVK